MNPLNLIKYVPLSVMRAMALFVAYIINFFPDISLARNININLRLVYPELDELSRKKLKRQAIRNQCLTAVESVKCWAMPPEWSLKNIRKVHNKEILTTALKNPNGMLCIVPHLGTWEMMNAWINQFGHPIIMYKPIKDERVDQFVLQGRERLNAQLVPTDASGVKAIFKALKSGQFSIILPDHVPQPSGGVIVPFFGINTLSSTLAPKLASKTKCALVGLKCIRNEQNSFDIFCHQFDDPNLYDKNINIATFALNQAMEKMINDDTEHYMWGYKRFKNVPRIDNPYNVSDAELEQFLNSPYKLSNQDKQLDK